MAGNQQGPTPTICTDEIIEEVARLVARRWRKSAIKRYVEDEVLDGVEVSARSVENLLAHARRLIAARSKRSKLEHIQLAIEFWEDQIADPDLSAKERQNAQVQLQNLMGIGGSFNVADTDTPDETAEQIRGALKEIETKHKDADEE